MLRAAVERKFHLKARNLFVRQIRQGPYEYALDDWDCDFPDL